MPDWVGFCRAHEAWVVDLIEELVSLESPSDDKAAVDRCGAAVGARLRAMGARVTPCVNADRGDHVVGALGEGDRQVLLLGHVDTVWPVGTLTTMPLRREGGRLWGPGAFDMKAGLAIALLASQAASHFGVLDGLHLRFVFTSDEEVGSSTSRGLIEDEARRSDAVLVFEPALAGGAVKTSRKGTGDFELEVRGVAAHAGAAPEEGASAVHELAHQILAIRAMHAPQRGTTINVGVIEGGTRSNVVAERARALIDVRVQDPDEAKRVDAALRALTPLTPRTTLALRGSFARPPFVRGPHVAALVELAKAAAAELGQSLDEGGTGGASDGNFTAALGVPTLDGLGALGDGAHARHEHVVIDALAPRAALAAALLARLARAAESQG